MVESETKTTNNETYKKMSWTGKVSKVTKVIFIKMVFCCFVYSTMLTQQLVNSHDATWNGTFNKGTTWELSIGRFMIWLYDIVNFGRHIQPFNLLMTLFICVIATELVAIIFDQSGENLINYCFSFMFLGNTVIASWLSYSYTTTMYAWGLLFAAVSSFIVSRFYMEKNKNNKMIYLILSSCFFAVTMGTYQSFLCCILIIVLFYIIFLVCSGETISNIILTMVAFLLTGILGFVIYEIILHLMLNIFDVTLDSYNGADSITVKFILDNLKNGIKICYENVFFYFKGTLFHISMFRYGKAFFVFSIFIVGSILFTVYKLDNKAIRIVIALGCLSVVPIATFITKILAPKSGLQMQQTASFAMLVPLVFITFVPLLKERVYWKKGVNEAIICLVSLVIIWGRIYSTLGDQEAMRETIYTRKCLSTEIYSAVINQGYVKDGYQIAIVGNPSKSPLFVHTPIYDDANAVATTDSDGWWTVIRAWRGVYLYDLGLNLPFVEQETYDNILGNEQVKQMPSFPNEGSIIEVENVVVVKVS